MFKVPDVYGYQLQSAKAQKGLSLQFEHRQETLSMQSRKRKEAHRGCEAGERPPVDSKQTVAVKSVSTSPLYAALNLPYDNSMNSEV